MRHALLLSDESDGEGDLLDRTLQMLQVWIINSRALGVDEVNVPGVTCNQGRKTVNEWRRNTHCLEGIEGMDE